MVDLVRVVTLKLSLRYLFQATDHAINGPDSWDNLKLIGQNINDLWIASKNKDEKLPTWSSPSNTDIHHALQAVCVSSDPNIIIDPLNPVFNPMNWLLPAYETMWRVVLVCVIELRFRNAPDAHLWCKTLADYIHNPTRDNFKGERITPGERGFCALDIVKETLRLYPPTSRVYRRFPGDKEDVKANIEACHHSADNFGPDPLCFRPGRWLALRAYWDLNGELKGSNDVKRLEEERGFMPFAVHCPAGKGTSQAFGFKMIALLAGVICEGLGKRREWDLENKVDYGVLTVPLPSDRAAFDEVRLVKRMGHTDKSRQ